MDTTPVKWGMFKFSIPKSPEGNSSYLKSNQSTNDDDQVHPNIELTTDPKKDEMKQDTDKPDKSKISIPKSPEGNSSYLQFNESTDNDKKELHTDRVKITY